MQTVIAGALGECAHVAGVINFLRLAETAGWKTIFLGPAVPIDTFLAAARQEQADLVGVSYRLTPETGERLLGEFAEAADDLRAAGVRFAFGGTPPVAERVRAIGFFERCFDSSEPDEVTLAYLKGQVTTALNEADYPQTMVERITWKAPFPLLRHHFGLPTMAATAAGISQIAEARVLDVISLGIDQEAQANFFHPERQDPRRTGAGGRRCATQTIIAPSTQPAGVAITPCCVHTPGPMTSFAWLRCTWKRSTSPGAPSPSSGLTRWMGAARGIWPALSGNTNG
jgi:methylmalonyl-CoA mutase cobalamin-binding subunit